MSSKAAARLGVALSLLIATTTLGGARPPPTDAFVAAQFTDPPAPAVLLLAGPLSTAVREILGHPYAHQEIRYWHAEGKTVWVLEGRGKTREITVGFVIREGQVERTEVLVYRESRGREIRAPSFTRQFEGASLTGRRALDRRIDGITGATISVGAMKDLVRLALYLTSIIPAK
jgi:hypothetical protein